MTADSDVTATNDTQWIQQQESFEQLLHSYERGDDVLATYKSKHLRDIDRPTGVLHVWYLVLEGLVGLVGGECPQEYQPQAVETLFQLLREASDEPGPEFALHCFNHLVLPTLQSWLRKGSVTSGYWTSQVVASFKHSFGLAADLVVHYVTKFAGGYVTHV